MRALRAFVFAFVFAVFFLLVFFVFEGGAAVLSTPPSDDLTASPTEAAMAATAPPALSTNPFIVDWTPSTTSSGGPSSSVNMAAMSPTVTRPPPRARAALRDFLLVLAMGCVGGGGLGCAWPLRRGSWLRVAALRVSGCEYAGQPALFWNSESALKI